MSIRKVHRVFQGRPTTDGAGVKLLRVLTPGMALDPILMLDEFASDDSSDYIAGFPEHPHRGFETVTYMLEGQMEHRDHMGNVGRIGPGDVQWMSAGRGVIHSEMPMQQEGRMHGFQLWINLPASEKMKPAAYQEISAENIPEIQYKDARIKVIAGHLLVDDEEVCGPVQAPHTDAHYFDLNLPPESSITLPVTAHQQLLLYCFSGDVQIAGKPLQSQQAALLDDGSSLSLDSGKNGARCLVLAGKPLREPVAHYGPFVMNSHAEIEQAIRDYQTGHLT